MLLSFPKQCRFYDNCYLLIYCRRFSLERFDYLSFTRSCRFNYYSKILAFSYCRRFPYIYFLTPFPPPNSCSFEAIQVQRLFSEFRLLHTRTNTFIVVCLKTLSFSKCDTGVFLKIVICKMQCCQYMLSFSMILLFLRNRLFNNDFVLSKTVSFSG